MDLNRFKALALAYEAGRTGGTMPTAMNAANEMAVSQFMAGNIPFVQIDELVERAMENHQTLQNPDLELIVEIDMQTRKIVESMIK